MSTRQDPFFSILTASYNRGTTIRNTLQSIMQQTFRRVEHIVIDGQSEDETVQILEEFSGKYNLSWISERDSGIADALNKGLNICKGKYIIVIQADDQLISDDILEKVHSLITNQYYDIYSFPIILDCDHKGKVLKKPIQKLWWNRFKFIFLHQGAFVHERVFQRIGGFTESFNIAMDYDFFYRALAHNSSVRFESLPVALMGGDGIGSRMSFLQKRLKEEARVQDHNERDPFWRMAQAVFRTCYAPYKRRFVPCMNALRGIRNNSKALTDRYTSRS